MKSLSKFVMLVAITVAFMSCEKDDTPVQPDKGDILISNLLPNPEGTSGSAFMQLINNLESAEYSNTIALPASYGVPPIIIGQDVYLLPGWVMATNMLEKYTRINGELVKQGVYELDPGTGANSLVVKGDKAYVSLCMHGKILIINHTNMTKLGEIDLSSYGVGDNNPDPAIAIIRDDLLYVGLNQLASGQYNPDPMRATTDILIIDTKTDTPVKMISKDGFSMPTKPEADENSIFMDEKGDIYVNCISGFGFLGHGAGFLRIKNGETEFDDSYAFDITQTAIDGEEQNADYLISTYYTDNGMLYATGNINAYYSMPEPNYFADMCVIPLEIDIYKQTIKKVPGLPMSCNYGFSVGAIDNTLYFGLATTTNKGFYSYNTLTKEASSEPIIKVEGYSGVIIKFE